MIRINLLPHRELRRKQNKEAFYRMLVLAAIFGAAIVFAVGGFIETRISNQDLRNEFIKGENARLDKQIEEIAGLKQEIDGLKARQQAVEDLQADRNQPVYLLDELVKQVPEGIFLRSFKQEGQKVSLVGVAQSNERVSELLHHLTNDSAWLEKAELVEIKAATTGQGREIKKVFEFTMNVGIKRPRDKEKADAAGISVAPGDKAASTMAGKPTTPADKASAASDKTAAAAKAASDAGGHGAAAAAPKKP